MSIQNVSIPSVGFFGLSCVIWATNSERSTTENLRLWFGRNFNTFWHLKFPFWWILMGIGEVKKVFFYVTHRLDRLSCFLWLNAEDIEKAFFLFSQGIFIIITFFSFLVPCRLSNLWTHEQLAAAVSNKPPSQEKRERKSAAFASSLPPHEYLLPLFFFTINFSLRNRFPFLLANAHTHTHKDSIPHRTQN